MNRILLVDDEPAIREIIRTVLGEENFTFAEASNGHEAQIILARQSFDLVMTDIIMPDCDGLELVMTLRESHPDLKIVVLSGGGRVSAEHYLDLAEKLGAVRVFEKPFNTEDLRTGVYELFAEEGALEEQVEAAEEEPAERIKEYSGPSADAKEIE